MYSNLCEDCGEVFDFPVSGPTQTRCEKCRFEYYQQKYAPRPDEFQEDTEHKKPLPDYEVITITTPEQKIKITAPAYHPEHEEEARKLREVHQRLGLIPKEPDLFSCVLCHQRKPRETLYFDPSELYAVCRSCASTALHTLSASDDRHVLKPYNQDHEADTLQDFRCPDCGRRFKGVAVQF